MERSNPRPPAVLSAHNTRITAQTQRSQIDYHCATKKKGPWKPTSPSSDAEMCYMESIIAWPNSEQLSRVAPSI
jgi:hypothetical protein